MARGALPDVEIAWLAGLLEGEASFGRATPGYPAVALKMTDRDVVERAAAAWPGATRVSIQKPNGLGTKDLYRIEWRGKSAKNLLWAVFPQLDRRRQDTAIEMLADYYEHRLRDRLHCGAPYYAHDRREAICSDRCRLDRRNQMERNSRATARGGVR